MLFRLIAAFMLMGLILASCKGRDEPIPSYVHVDSATLITGVNQGTKIHAIQFVYAYVDGDLLGVFELPATIPVLKDGKHKLTFTPAIALNGSNNQVTVHTGILPEDTMVDLTRGKVATVSSVPFSFRSNSNFVWLEDFEDNSSTVSGISVPDGDTTYISEAYFELNGRFAGNTKVFTAEIASADSMKYLDLGSFNAFSNLPNDSRDIFLEFDIRSDIPVQLGLKRTNSKGPVYVPYLYMYSTDKKWKHFYVNLVYETSGQEAGTTYQILFSSDIPAFDLDRTVQLDNIRLSHNN